MDYLFLIPARAGSKGIPHKNTRLLAGKPLISYTIECALNIAKPKDICISTDDEMVIKIAEQYGLSVPFIRPPELSTDTASQYDVIKHAIDFYFKKNCFYKSVVLLQPTSPLRKSKHTMEAMALYKTEYDMIVSVKQTEANPYFVLYKENKQGLLEKVINGNFVRRQDCPDVWQINGSNYIINTASVLKYKSFSEFKIIRKHTMPSIASLDIDTELDWRFSEFIIKNGLNE
jgi:CMP-N,N'-diacetyllegionaminic acid synthase